MIGALSLSLFRPILLPPGLFSLNIIYRLLSASTKFKKKMSSQQLLIKTLLTRIIFLSIEIKLDAKNTVVLI